MFLRKTLLSFIVVFCLNGNCFSQPYLPGCAIYFEDEKVIGLDSLPSTITLTNNDGSYRVYRIYNNYGKADFESYNKNKMLIEKGSYSESLDTLKRYSYRINPVYPYEAKILIERYFEPLKNGIWLYYDEKGNLVLTEIWVNGIRQE